MKKLRTFKGFLKILLALVYHFSSECFMLLSNWPIVISFLLQAVNRIANCNIISIATSQLANGNIVSIANNE